jgi:hypothetical protein
MDVVPILAHPLTKSQRLCSTINTLAARVECPADLGVLRLQYVRLVGLASTNYFTRDGVIVCDVLI